MQRTSLCDFCGETSSHSGLAIIQIASRHVGDCCQKCAENIRTSIDSTMTAESKAYYKKLTAEPVHRPFAVKNQG